MAPAATGQVHLVDRSEQCLRRCSDAGAAHADEGAVRVEVVALDAGERLGAVPRHDDGAVEQQGTRPGARIGIGIGGALLDETQVRAHPALLRGAASTVTAVARARTGCDAGGAGATRSAADASRTGTVASSSTSDRTVLVV